MGLDSVELVMEVEDRFNVKLPDAECERVRTVADLAALVIARLPRSNVVCPTARSFFEFRRLLMNEARIERREIRPSLRLRDLFRVRIRTVWKLLRSHDPRIPPLVASARVDQVFLGTAAALFFTILFVIAALVGRYGIATALPIAGLAIIVSLFGFVTLWDRFKNYLPVGVETVGDVARVIAPMELPMSSAGERLVAHQRVLDEVRRITAEQLGLPLDEVHATSDFVKDLHID